MITRHLLRLSLMAITFASSLAGASYRVVVDPGHGGADNGAVRANLKEADIVLSISKKLFDIFKKNPEFEPYLTRKGRETLSLKDRVEQARAFEGDLFLSIHANASIDSRAKGVEFYFSPALSGQEATLWLNHLSLRAQLELTPTDVKGYPNSSLTEVTSEAHILLEELKDQHRSWESQELSRSLMDFWEIPGQKKIVRQAPFYVVHSNGIPAVLIEVGYLSNARERKKLTSSSYQQVIAEQIFQGVQHFKEIMDNR